MASALVALWRGAKLLALRPLTIPNCTTMLAPSFAQDEICPWSVNEAKIEALVVTCLPL